MKLHRISFVSALIFSVLVSPVFAEGSWEEKEYGTIQGLQGMVEVGDMVFAGGNSGNIIRSQDDGETWEVFDQNATAYWQDMGAFGQTVWAIGEGATMRQSDDGGATWGNVTLSVTENLYDLDASDDYAYLVGSGGRIMAYQTAAKLWLSVSSPVTSALYRVQDMGDGTAWIVGTEGVLLSTTDGGQNWTNLGMVASNDLYGIWFTSATEGYVVGRSGIFRKTTDAGVSWADVSVSGVTNQHLYDIRGSGDELVVVGDKILMRSEDGGATWTVTDYTDENYTFRNAYVSDGGTWAVGTKDDIASVMVRYEEEVIEEEVEEEEITEEEATEEEVEEEEVLTPVEAEPGTLIKSVCLGETDLNDPCRSVYYYATDGKRHAFPNEKVFFTWFDDFDSVVDVSSDFLSDIALGSNVTYHPGTRMVKFLSVPTVYAVVKGGELRSIASEEIATELYGDDWNQQIDDISDAFYGNYTFGEPIESAEDYVPDLAAEAVTTLDDNF